MPGISSSDAATHASTYLFSALKNIAPAIPFAPLGTENLMYLEKFHKSSKAKSYHKTKLRQLKHTQPPPRVEPQAVTIPAAQTPQTRSKDKPGTPTHPHNIPFEETEYSTLRVETYPVSPAPQPVHKYPTRHKNG